MTITNGKVAAEGEQVAIGGRALSGADRVLFSAVLNFPV